MLKLFSAKDAKNAKHYSFSLHGNFAFLASLADQ
jgi:hypothetical protein